jgi:hypothetical protein
MIDHMTRRQWARLWGQKHMIKPVFIKQALGNGDKLVAITPLNTRPNYYLIRVDSSWSVRNSDDSNICDHIDEISEAIEEECGRKYETDDDDEEIVMPWPALDDEVGVSWCDSMDLLGGRP